MDQRPGQNVDLGLYFHREGPVSPKTMLKNRFLADNFKNIFEISTKISMTQKQDGGVVKLRSMLDPDWAPALSQMRESSPEPVSQTSLVSNDVVSYEK